MKKDTNTWIVAICIICLLALMLLPKPGYGQSRDTSAVNHTGYFDGQTFFYTCTHPNHGKAWRLNTPPCQPVAVKLPRYVEQRRKKTDR